MTTSIQPKCGVCQEPVTDPEVMTSRALQMPLLNPYEHTCWYHTPCYEAHIDLSYIKHAARCQQCNQETTPKHEKCKNCRNP